MSSNTTPQSFSNTHGHGFGPVHDTQTVKNNWTKNNHQKPSLPPPTESHNEVPHYIQHSQLLATSLAPSKNTISPTVITQQNLILNKHVNANRQSSKKKTSNVISSTESSATAIPVNTTEILEWIKDLASSIGNAKNSSNTHHINFSKCRDTIVIVCKVSKK